MTSVMCQDEVRVSWHVTTRRLLYELPNQVKSYALTSLHTPDHFPNQTEWVLVSESGHLIGPSIAPTGGGSFIVLSHQPGGWKFD